MIAQIFAIILFGHFLGVSVQGTADKNTDELIKQARFAIYESDKDISVKQTLAYLKQLADLKVASEDEIWLLSVSNIRKENCHKEYIDSLQKKLNGEIYKKNWSPLLDYLVYFLRLQEKECVQSVQLSLDGLTQEQQDLATALRKDITSIEKKFEYERDVAYAEKIPTKYLAEGTLKFLKKRDLLDASVMLVPGGTGKKAFKNVLDKWVTELCQAVINVTGPVFEIYRGNYYYMMGNFKYGWMKNYVVCREIVREPTGKNGRSEILDLVYSKYANRGMNLLRRGCYGASHYVHKDQHKQVD